MLEKVKPEEQRAANELPLGYFSLPIVLSQLNSSAGITQCPSHRQSQAVQRAHAQEMPRLFSFKPASNASSFGIQCRLGVLPRAGPGMGCTGTMGALWGPVAQWTPGESRPEPPVYVCIYL